MKRKKGFTLIELLVVIAIIAMLLAILMPALSKVKKIAMRVICGTNLKGLGTAQTVYASENEDEYTVQGQGGQHSWGANPDDITSDWQIPAKIWTTPNQNITIGASLYLLVREADVSPGSFVCPSGNEKEFDGKNPDNFDLVELWDFGSYTYGGTGPQNCVSYSYHQPYVAGGTGTSTGSKSRYAADGTRSSSFAVMADQNPWFDNLTRGAGNGQNYKDMVWKLGNDAATVDNIDNMLQKFQLEIGNAKPHDREGQNVLFADGHCEYENRADVGIKYDNIYVPQNGTTGGVLEVRTGKLVIDKLIGTVPVSSSDSILANDGAIATTAP
jgi:prepilin-type N-terminal cleavage/methylation domain-containing protein/prepilin-type processing-associated H-X9-DG protein